MAARQQTPRELDERVLGMARQASPHIGGWRVRLVAAAALVLAIGGVAVMVSRSEDHRMMPETEVTLNSPGAEASRHDPFDVNQDGSVDVLDAWTLSRAICRGDAPACDLDANGQTDDDDVETLMARIVRVGGRDRSAS